jgi:hypothetical protein
MARYYAWLLCIWIVTVPVPGARAQVDPDRDGDGLSDFQEVHKYRTDPSRKGTAGDGVSDGDWARRREFTYSVRALIRLMPPYNLTALNDDYQDARVVSQTKEYVELEVVLYPLNTNSEAIEANKDWRKDYAAMREYLAPGVTTDWDETMRQDLLRELKSAGIDPDKLTDKEVVEQVSRWLFKRSTYKNMFCTHYIHFPGGKPAVFPGLEQAFQRDKGGPDWTTRQQFEHELLGREMFYHKTNGSCTSSAVLQATVLRALGIPTRIIVASPIVDGSDPAQVALVSSGLTHHQVRVTVRRAVQAVGGNYTAHTFLEVFVGRRWRRLNYSKLGQNILDPVFLGLMVHVHTFNDLSEANLAPTWGARYALGKRDAEFRHSNPYRTVALDDHFGRHANVPNPPVREHHHITITRAYWTDAPDAPEDVRQWAAQHRASDGRARLYIHGDEWWDDAGDYLQYRVFLDKVDKHLVLRAPGRPDVRASVTGSFFTSASSKLRDMEVAIPPEEYGKMVRDVPYTIHPVNGVPGYRWRVKDGVTITRTPSVEERLEQVLRRLDKLERRLEALEKRRGGSRSP